MAGNETRRPPGAPGVPSSSASSATGASGVSRAERFDDERKRITESCFARVDDKGQRMYQSIILCLLMCPQCLFKLGERLTRASRRILHHPHPHTRRCRLSAVASPTEWEPHEQESACDCCFGTSYGAGPPSQGSRKCKRHLFNWQDVEHGGAYRSGELRTFESAERGGSKTETMGGRCWFHSDHTKTVLLGGWHGKGEGILHWEHGENIPQVYKG